MDKKSKQKRCDQSTHFLQSRIKIHAVVIEDQDLDTDTIEEIIQGQADRNSELYMQMKMNHCLEELRETELRLFYVPISVYA